MTTPDLASYVDALVEVSPVGMAVFDAELRFVRVNRVLAEVNGVPAEAHLGRTLREVLPELAPVVEPLMARVLATGVAERDIPVRGATPLRPGIEREWRVSYVPLSVRGTAALASYVEERTEQVVAERALRAQEHEFRAIAEALPIGLILRDPSGMIVYGNPAYARIAGISVEAAEGGGWKSVIHPDDLARVTAGVQRAATSGEPFLSEHRHFFAAGREVWVSTRTFPVFLGGTLQRVVTLLEDITTRRASAEALRASEERFRTICEVAPLGIFLSDENARVIYSNPAAERILGRTTAEIRGKGWGSAVHPDDRAEVERVVATAQKGPGGGFTVSTRLVHPDGTIIWTETQSRNLYDGERYLGRVSLTSDVTERRRMVQAVYESEALFRELSENVDAVFYLARPDASGVDFVSQGFEKVWGRTIAELQANPLLWMAAIHPEDRESVASSFEHDRAHFQADYRVIRPDGAIRWISDRSFPVRDADGKIVRIAGIATDETERRTLEAQLLQSQRLESIGRLAGGVAHDFNNLLTVIMSHAAFARQDVANAAEDLVSIERAGRRAAELTAQLLAFARRQVIEPRVVDLNALTGQIDRMLQRLIGASISLQTQLQPSLWPVKVDPAQMEQVLVNLAVNARDAMPDGGTLTIETANVTLGPIYAGTHADVSPGAYVMVAVSDSGEGIDPAFLPMIFEPFFTTKLDGAGTGLGLATCYGIVEQAGGHIWAYSEPGRGATFKVYLPKAEGVAAEVALTEPIEATGGNETVLLVEDDADVRAIGVRTLRSQGFQVLEAVDGIDAMTVARGYSGMIHVLVTDVVMPRMGGKELAERLSAERPEMRILFASGYTRNAIVHQGVLEKGTSFLQKPYVPAVLVARVREVLDEEGGKT
jgi:PAS domain S-box-containing protein